MGGASKCPIGCFGSFTWNSSVSLEKDAMMIDHQRKVIFIHIPKTAGISIYNMMRYSGSQNHKTRLDYEEDYFSVRVVRNPWDRLVSAYSYVKNGGRGSWRPVRAECSLVNR